MEEEAAAAAGVKGMHPSLDESSPVQPTKETSTDEAAAEEHSDAVMPVSEIMAMLQVMREEQVQTLNKIADGVQQLQSQVLVLGETATASDANTRLCLERLAGVEVRIGSIPTPIAAPNNFQRQPGASQPQRMVGGGGGVSRAPPPPAPGPSYAPTWLDRKAEREPTRPHFMRSTSQQSHPRVSPARSTPTTIPASTLQAAQTAVAVASTPTALSAEPRAISAEEAAKEAKRKAFMEDRARMQERIAARKANTGPSANSMKPSPTPGPPAAAAAAPTRTPTTPVTQPQTPQPQPRQPQGVASSAGNNPFASGAGAGFVGHARASSAEPFFGSSGLLEGVSAGGGAGNATAEEEEAAWLERERAQREKKERERREAVERERKRREEEEARLARERAEAKRLKEEEEARLLREAEEARERERKKREVEARRQAKTRDIMSSLFDKEEDGGSLFGSLGAALPAGGSVFDEGGGGGGLSSLIAPASAAVVYDPPAEGTKASASAPVASSSSPVGSGGGSGSLFAGIRDGVGVGGAAGRGLFDRIDAYPSSNAPQSSHEAFGSRDSGYGAAVAKEPSTLFEPSPLLKDPPSPAGATVAAVATVAGDRAAADEIERIFSSEGFDDNKHEDSYQPFFVQSERRNPVEDYEDFLSSPPPDRGVSSVAGVTSTAAAAGTSDGSGARAAFGPTASATHARKSLFPDDDFGDSAEHHEDDDNIFSASATAQGSAPYLGSGAKGTTAAADVRGGSHPTIGGVGTSLFDRPEFSIDDPDDEAGNVFAGRSGRGAGEAPGVSGDRIGGSFLTALEDSVPVSGQDQGGQGAPGRDGMVDVTL